MIRLTYGATRSGVSVIEGNDIHLIRNVMMVSLSSCFDDTPASREYRVRPVYVTSGIQDSRTAPLGECGLQVAA